MKKKLLIIGGTGFLGSSIIFYIRNNFKSNFEISSISLHKPKKKILGVKYIVADIKKIKKLAYYNYVIYAANYSDKKFYKKKLKFIEKNSKNGLLNILNLLKKKKDLIKLIYLSSGAVYGYHKKFPKNGFSENQSINLKNVNLLNREKRIYAKIKIFEEELIKKFSSKKLNCTIARLFTFIGPFVPLKKHFAIGNFLNSILKKKDIVCFTNSKKTFRSYMHTDDLSNLLLQIFKKSDKKCHIYNIGSVEPISIFQLALFISKKYKVKLKLIKSKSDYIDRYYPSMKKAMLKFRLNKFKTISKSFDLTIKKLKNK